MKTEQEQIEEMSCVLTMFVKNCDGGCMSQYCHLVDNCAKKLIEAGYGDVSEYKAEIERLRTTLGQCNTELNSALESLKSQCREIGALKAGTKQAQIDVLNKLKERASGYTFLGEKLATETDIDELIKEVQNGEDKS